MVTEVMENGTKEQLQERTSTKNENFMRKHTEKQRYLLKLTSTEGARCYRNRIKQRDL